MNRNVLGVSIVAATTVLIMFFVHLQSIQWPAERQKAEHWKEQAQTAPENFDLVCPAPAEGVKSIPTDQCKRQGHYSYDREQQLLDNRAQISMKRAAWIGVVFGGMGMILLAWTLLETRKGADAAWKAVKITRDTAQNQLRAYLDVDARLHNLTNFSDHVLIKVTIKNRGQTPAFNLTMNVIMIESGDDCIKPIAHYGPNTIDPSGHMSFSVHIDKKWKKTIIKNGIKFHYTIGFMDTYGNARNLMARLGLNADGVPKAPKILRGKENPNYIASKSIGIFFQSDDVGLGAMAKHLKQYQET